jgi:drug/metabolite transporter (DMT)-like permease
VTIAAVLVLGEVVRLRRWTAVIAGFAGVLVILRPGASAFSFDALVALASAALAAGSYISIKFLSRTEHPDAVVIYMNLIITPLTLMPALWAWSWPDAIGWIWLLLTGLLGTVGQFCMTRAYHVGEVSALIPINFIQLPVVVICAYFLFDQRLDLATAIGAAIIIGANIYIARREAQLARRSAPAAAAGAAIAAPAADGG